MPGHLPSFTPRRDYGKTDWSDGVLKNPKSQAPNNKQIPSTKSDSAE
jgi:hypothetical protein